VVVVLAEGFTGAQQAPKTPRVCYLGGPRLFEAFQQGLRELGYVEGQNIIVERGIPGKVPGHFTCTLPNSCDSNLRLSSQRAQRQATTL
jgi:hypothetical protein